MATDQNQDLPPSGSDSRQDVPEEPPSASVARAKLRAAATYSAQATATLNAGPVLPMRDPASGKLRYETTPVPLKRLFGSPLAPKGSRYTVILKGVPVRRVSSGWGDARSSAYDDKANHSRRHGGLDFPAPVGEAVLAAADGIVTFVGVQRRTGGSLALTAITVDGNGNPVGTDVSGKQVSVDVKQLGFGGVFVQITHNSDFQGFKTEYFHLSATTVTKGQKVLEGDAIGKIGTSGGYRGIVQSGSHLHWQARFGGGDIIVKPEPLVLHYNPRSPSDAPGADILAETMIQLQKHNNLSAGELAIVGAGIGDVRAQNRAVDMQNQSLADHRQRQADHYQYVAQQDAVGAGRLHQATAQFQATQPVVQNPMTFDFKTGLWSDGKAL